MGTRSALWEQAQKALAFTIAPHPAADVRDLLERTDVDPAVIKQPITTDNITVYVIWLLLLDTFNILIHLLWPISYLEQAWAVFRRLHIATHRLAPTSARNTWRVRGRARPAVQLAGEIGRLPPDSPPPLPLEMVGDAGSSGGATCAAGADEAGPDVRHGRDHHWSWQTACIAASFDGGSHRLHAEHDWGHRDCRGEYRRQDLAGCWRTPRDGVQNPVQSPTGAMACEAEQSGHEETKPNWDWTWARGARAKRCS